MIKVLVITSIHPDFDGRIWKHCNSLKRLGYSVTLLCQWDSIKGRKTVDGVEIINYGVVGGRGFRMIKNNFKLFYWLNKLEKFNIYHFHDIDILPTMSLWSLAHDVVYDIHENYPEEMLERHWIPKVLRSFFYYFVWFYQYTSVLLIKNVVLVTESQEGKLPKKAKIIYIYNYANPVELSAKDILKVYDFIFTASQYKENGIEVLLCALKKFKRDNIKTSVLVANRFPSVEYRNYIMNKIIEFDIEEYIVFFDHVEPHNLYKVIASARIGLVLDLETPRRIMAIPTKIFEYMANGLFVIGSSLPNTRRFLSSHVGSCFVPGDCDSLYNNMVRVRSLSIESKSIRKYFAVTFSWESQDENYEKYYDEILSEKQSIF